MDNIELEEKSVYASYFALPVGVCDGDKKEIEVWGSTGKAGGVFKDMIHTGVMRLGHR